MKKNIVINSLLIILMIVFIVFSFEVALKYKTKINDEENSFKNLIQDCQKNMNSSNDISYKNYCKSIIDDPLYKPDFFSVFSNVLIFDMQFLNFFVVLIIFLLVSRNVCYFLKYGYIENSITRESYKSSISKIMKSAYKNIWIIPIIGLIIIIPIALNFTFDCSYAVYYGKSIWPKSIMKVPIVFILLYEFNLLLHSILYTNISLIVSRKQHNYIIAFILSILFFLGLELFLEIFSGMFFNYIFGVSIGSLFNIVNLFRFNTDYGIFPLFAFILTFSVVSSLIVYILYRNPEKLINDCEKNN